MNTDTSIKKHFTKRALLKYSMPAILMMFTISAYEIIDGFFLSNFVGATAFAAVNLIFPVLMILTSFGMMMGTGSSAIIANKMGQGDNERANRYFSMFIYFIIVGGIALSLIGILIMRPAAQTLGATGDLLEIATYYGLISLISLPAYILETACIAYYNTAGKPSIGFINSIMCCISVFVLDFIFVGQMGMGINGILIATVASEFIGGIFPLIYFLNKKNKSLLHLVSPKIAFKNQNPSSLRLILKSALNGSSEAVQETASSLVVLLCMFQLNRYIGQDGLVAYGIIDYAWIVFNSFYLGFSVAVAPLMSYQQGANNKLEMRSLLKNSYIIIIIASVISFTLSFVFARQIASVFVDYDQSLLEYSTNAFRIYSIAFLFAGISIYGSSLFTSLGDGLISALIAFMRMFLFEVVALIVLPIFLGDTGIWYSIGSAEIFAAITTVIFVLAKRAKYFKD